MPAIKEYAKEIELVDPFEREPGSVKLQAETQRVPVWSTGNHWRLWDWFSLASHGPIGYSGTDAFPKIFSSTTRRRWMLQKALAMIQNLTNDFAHSREPL